MEIIAPISTISTKFITNLNLSHRESFLSIYIMLFFYISFFLSFFILWRNRPTYINLSDEQFLLESLIIGFILPNILDWTKPNARRYSSKCYYYKTWHSQFSQHSHNCKLRRHLPPRCNYLEHTTQLLTRHK